MIRPHSNHITESQPFQIERSVNTPFYLKGLAFGDVVRVRPDHERRELVFEEFLAESGHSTVRVVVKEAGAEPGLSDLLLGFGCSWEIDSSGILWAVDVPPEV